MRTLLIGALASAGLVVAAVPAQAVVVVRSGEPDEFDRLQGDLILVAQGDPLSLADVAALAAQVRSAGIARVTGDVIVDSRAAPVVVAGNRISVTVRPGAAGRRARVAWSPRPTGWTLANGVLTGARTRVRAREGAGHQVALTGQIARRSRPVRVRVRVRNPDAFARTLLIAALARAGVEVDANAATGNPTGRLPATAQVSADPIVAHLP